MGGAYGAYEYEEEEEGDDNPAQNSIGTVNENEAVSDSDDASVLERGDAVKMKRRRSSAASPVSSGGYRDSVQGSGAGGAPGPQIRKGRGVGA